MQVENEKGTDYEEMDEDDDYSKEINSYLTRLKEDPYNYNSYNSLIEVYKKLGDFEELREIRLKMSEHFPLREDLWLDWIKDEMRMNNLASSDSDDENENANSIENEAANEHACVMILKLFEKAVKDYLSIEIWLEYVQFSIGQMQRIGLEAVRDIFEKALSSCGLHVTKGAIIWEAYREFENALLGTYESQLEMIRDQFQNAQNSSKSGANLSEETQLALTPLMSQVEVQRQAVLSLFKRQLTVPLLGMEATQKEFTTWWHSSPFYDSEPGNSHSNKQLYSYDSILSSSTLAQAKLVEILPFEDAIHSARLKLLESKSDGKRIEDQIAKDKATLTEEQGSPKAAPSATLSRGSLENYRERKEFRITLLNHYKQYLTHEIAACCGGAKKKAPAININGSDGETLPDIGSTINAPSRVVCLFERALEDHNTLDAELWLWYARDFLELQLHDRSGARVVYVRAVRNCCLGSSQPLSPASVELWIGLIRLAERQASNGFQGVDLTNFCLDTGASSLNTLLSMSSEGTATHVSPDIYFNFALAYCVKHHDQDINMNGHVSRREQEKIVVHAKNATKLWMAYLEYVRRQLHQSNNDEIIKTKFRDSFASACQNLTLSYGSMSLGDPDHSITIFWARSEAFIFKDIVKCRQLWNSLIKDIGCLSSMWLEWYWIERVAGDVNECRKILQRALNTTTDFPELILNESINFERDIGCDIDTWERCQKKWRDIQKRNLERQLKVVECQRIADEEHSTRKSSRRSKTSPHLRNREDKYHGSSSKSYVKKYNEHKLDSTRSRNFKSKRDVKENADDIYSSETAFDRKGDKRKLKAPDVEVREATDYDSSLKISSPKKGSHVPNLQNSTNHNVDIPDSNLISIVMSPKDSDGFAIPKVPQSGVKHKTTNNTPEGNNAFFKYQSKNLKPEEVQDEKISSFPDKASFIPDHPLAPNEESVDQEMGQNQEAPEPSLDYSQLSDQTIFLSNLSYKITSKDIKDFFSQFGEIENIHIVKTRKGKTKGFAYLVYKDGESVSKALKADRSPLVDRPVFISPYGKRINNPQNFRYNTGLEKNKLFVRNLPYATTEDQLKASFQTVPCKERSSKEHLKGVRLVYDNNGRSKGCAYVEFDSDEIAQLVLAACNDSSNPFEIEGRPIYVALSDPPGPSNKTQAHLQHKQGKNLSGPHKRLDITNTANSLLPRQLRFLKFDSNKS